MAHSTHLILDAGFIVGITLIVVIGFAIAVVRARRQELSS